MMTTLPSPLFAHRVSVALLGFAGLCLLPMEASRAQDAPAPEIAPKPASVPPAAAPVPPAPKVKATPAPKAKAPTAPASPTLGSASSAASVEDDGLQLPDHPATAAAKAAYNGFKYGEAIGHFRILARRWPANAAVYRALARACTWDGKINQAINAYRAYLVLRPDAGDREKIQAELDLVLRKSKRPPKEGPPRKVAKALKRITTQIEAGKFGGKKGAIALYQTLMQGDYIGPALAQARDGVHAALIKGSENAVTAWWNPAESLSGQTSSDLVSGWTELAKVDALMPRKRESLTAAVTGLDHLVSARYAEAVTTLAPVAPSDSRLRYAQAIALLGAKRTEEAKQVLQALSRGDVDPRIHLALGLLGGANKTPAGLDSLHQALSEP